MWCVVWNVVCGVAWRVVWLRKDEVRGDEMRGYEIR